MQNIHRVHFPLSLAFGARGGPQRLTEISTAASGHEMRNSPLSQSRRHYDAGAGIKSLDDLDLLLSFFEARRGQLHGFLFTDPVDHKSCKPSADIAATDQIIAAGDGVTTHFTLQKTYADSAGSYTRALYFINPQTLKIAVDGQMVSVSFDEQNGQCIFQNPPASGTIITAGFHFYTPVRFDAPSLDISLEAFGAGQAASVPLIEIIPHV